MAARNPFASSVPDIFDPYGLVQSRRPMHSTGYYFVKNLLLVGAVVGGVVALYRNDVFLDLARRVGQEQRYLDAEKVLVGTPGWGTPRSMEAVLKQGDAAPSAIQPAAAEATPAAAAVPTTGSEATTATTTAATAAAQAAAPTAPAEAAPAPVAERTPAPAETARLVAAPAPVAATPAVAVAVPVTHAAKSDSLSPVSFGSLPAANHGGAARSAPAEPAPVRTAALAPVHTAAPAPVAPAPVSKPAPVDRHRVKAIKVTLEETPEPASNRSVPLPTRAAHAPPPAPPPPAPVATKPAKPEPPQPKASDVHESDNPLLAAVRGAVRKHPPKSSVPAAE
jgi:hypothetical protein